MLSGWGFDIAGLPIPSSGNSDDLWRFDLEAVKDRSKWKTGPVDLRWHKARKVWTGGCDMVEGILMEDLYPASDFNTPSNAKLKVYRSEYDGSSNNQKLVTKEEFVSITNRDPTLLVYANGYVIAAEINYEWKVIWNECNTSESTNTNPPPSVD